MDNKEFLEKLKFGVGDGNLQYYIYNWQCPMMNPDKVYSSLIDHQTHSSSRFPRWHYCFNRSTIEIPSSPIKKKEKDIQLCDFFISFSHTFPNKKKTSKKITKICFNECNDFPKQATRTVATRKPRERDEKEVGRLKLPVQWIQLKIF